MNYAKDQSLKEARAAGIVVDNDDDFMHGNEFRPENLAEDNDDQSDEDEDDTGEADPDEEYA